MVRSLTLAHYAEPYNRKADMSVRIVAADEVR